MNVENNGINNIKNVYSAAIQNAQQGGQQEGVLFEDDTLDSTIQEILKNANIPDDIDNKTMNALLTSLFNSFLNSVISILSGLNGTKAPERTPEKQQLDKEASNVVQQYAKSALAQNRNPNQGTTIKDSNGNPVKINMSSNHTANGLEQSVRYSYTDKTQKDDSDPIFEQIQYDKQGRPTSKITYRRDGKQQETKYTYDANGNAVETKSNPSAVKTGNFKDILNSKLSFENGKYKTTYTNSLGGKEVYIYDTNGREVLHTQNYNKDGIDNTRTETTYDKQGNSVRSQKHTDKNGKVSSEWIEKSDSTGKWTNITKKENGVEVSVDYTKVPFDKQSQNIAWQVMEQGNFPKGTKVDVKLDATGKKATVKATAPNGQVKEYNLVDNGNGVSLTESKNTQTTKVKVNGVNVEISGKNLNEKQIKEILSNIPDAKNVKLAFDSNGNMTSKEVTTDKGTVHEAYSNYKTQNGVTTRTAVRNTKVNVPQGTIGGFLAPETFTQTLNDKGFVTTETATLNNGESYTNKYSSNGKLSSVVYKNAAGKKTQETKYGLTGWQYTYKYDDKGNKVDYTALTEDGSFNTHITYKYDKNNKLTNETWLTKDGEVFVEKEYDKSGKVISGKQYNRDESGKICGVSQLGKDGKTESYTHYNKDNTTDIYKYNSNGQIIQKTTQPTNGYGTVTNEYYSNFGTDSKGRLTRKAVIIKSTNQPGIDGTAAPQEYTQVVDKVGMGIVLEQTNTKTKVKTVNTYAADKCTRTSSKDYDANGQLLNEIKYRSDKSISQMKTYKNGQLDKTFLYDNKGNIISTTDNNGNKIEGTVTYNKDGSIKSKTVKEGNIVKTTNYTYNSDGSVTQKTTQSKDMGNGSMMASSSDPISELTTYKNGKTVEKIYSMDGSLAPKTITKEGNKTTTVETQPTNLYNNSSYTKTTVEVNGKKTQETYKKSFFLPGNAREEGYTINYSNGVELTKSEYKTQGDGYGNSTTTTTKSFKGIVNERDVEVKKKDGSSTKTETHLYSDGRVYYEDKTEYGTNGKLTSKEHKVVNGGGTGNYKELYDNNGNVTMTIKDWNMDGKTDYVVITDANALQNMPKELKGATGKIEIKLYDKDAVGNKYTTLGYAEYDSNGKLKSQINPDGGKTEFTYNAQGSKTQEKKYDKNGNLLGDTHFYSDGRVYYQEEYTYDNKNQKTSHTHKVVNGGGTYDYTEYFKNGKLTSKTSVYPSGEKFSDAKYNTNGKMTEETFYNKDGSVMNKKTYEYDSNGKLRMSRSYDKNNRMIANSETAGDTRIDRTFSYNANGTLNGWIQKIFNKGIQTREITYDRKTGHVTTYELVEKTDAQGHKYYEKQVKTKNYT